MRNRRALSVFACAPERRGQATGCRAFCFRHTSTLLPAVATEPVNTAEKHFYVGVAQKLVCGWETMAMSCDRLELICLKEKHLSGRKEVAVNPVPGGLWSIRAFCPTRLPTLGPGVRLSLPGRTENPAGPRTLGTGFRHICYSFLPKRSYSFRKVNSSFFAEMMTTISINLGRCVLFRTTAGRCRGVFPLTRASGTFTNAVVEAQMIAVERDRLLIKICPAL